MLKKIGWFVGLLIIISMAVVISAQDVPDVETTEYVYFFGSGGRGSDGTPNISGLAVKASGNLLIANDANRISEFTQYGELVAVNETDAAGDDFGVRITGLQVTPDGMIVVITEQPYAAKVYNDVWELQQTITPAIDGQAAYTTYDATNDLFYAWMDQSFAITVFDSTGTIQNTIETQVNNPEGTYILLGSLGIDGAGNVVSSYGGGTNPVSGPVAVGAVQIYQPDGELVTQWVTPYDEEEVAYPEGLFKIRFYGGLYGLVVDSVGRIYGYNGIWKNGKYSASLLIYAPDGTQLQNFIVTEVDNPQGARLALSPDEKILYVSTENTIHILSLSNEPPFTSVEMAENGRLRDAPSTDGAVVDSVQAGSLLIVTGQNEAGDWLQVRHEGKEAWVAAFLTKP